MEDLHLRWQHRWITPNARAQNSAVHGLGTVATKPISKGEAVSVLGGIIVPSSSIGEYRKKMGHVGIQVDDDFFICPSTRSELEETGVFNHSCEPNIGYANTLKFIAIRDIRAGEELVFDYAFGEISFEPFECNCGSAKCRKIIKPDDWKNPRIQSEYGEYFSPYQKARIKK
ncbi:MAG: SET domain-containing protein-lysine N-methyltransferase [Candidatus Micrarchaeota archaeon]